MPIRILKHIPAAWWFLVLLSLLLFLWVGKWQHHGAITGDARGYSAYLNAWVIHGEWNFDFYDDLSTEEKERLWLNEHEGGKRFPKLTMGVALLQWPGFVVAHGLAPVTGHVQDGWSTPYQLAVAGSGLLALWLGCLLVFKLVHRRYSGWVAAWTMLLVATATNLGYYGVLDGGQSHVYSFALLALGLFGTDTWLRNNGFRWLWWAAFAFGMMVLIRPTNAVFSLVPLIWVIHQKRFKSLLNWKLIPALLIAVLPFGLQMFFWHLETGNWLVYSYGGEQIFWANSHWMEGLFSARNGWLVYAPVMAFALVGIPLLWTTDRSWMWSSIAVLPIHIYIVFAWWCWYYGSSFGIRPMVDSYALLALPLAAFLRWVTARSLGILVLATLLSALLVTDNVIHSWQYHKGWLSGSAMTWNSYRLLAFNTDPPRDLRAIGCLNEPDVDRLLLGKPERMKRDTTVEQAWSAPESTMQWIDAHQPFGPILRVPLDEVRTDFDRWMMITAQVKAEGNEFPNSYLVMEVKSSEGSHLYKTIGLHRLRWGTDEYHSLTTVLRKPKNLPSDAWIECYFWIDSSRGKIYWRDLELKQIDTPFAEDL